MQRMDGIFRPIGRAPAAGIVVYVCSVPSMTKGGTIANVVVVTK
jgi:hypothetical protein